MALHATFTADNGGLSAATAYRDALDFFWCYPIGDSPWTQHFADPIANIYAQANPLDPRALWALNIAEKFAPRGEDPEDASTYVYALGSGLATAVPFPTGAGQQDIDMNDPEWLQPPDE